MLRALVAAGVLAPEALSFGASGAEQADAARERRQVVQQHVSDLTQDIPTSLGAPSPHAQSVHVARRCSCASGTLRLQCLRRRWCDGHAAWTSRMACGAEAGQMRKLFDLEAGFHHLNHGSYGATLRVARQAAEMWRAAADASPSRFMEEDAVPALMHAVSVAADVLQARPSDCVPVANATTGMTTALRAVDLSGGGAVLVLSCAYGSVKTAVGRVAESAGAEVVELEVDLECAMQPALVAERLRGVLEAEGGRVRAVVMDHVVSFPPIVLPVAEMTAICREVRSCPPPTHIFPCAPWMLCCAVDAGSFWRAPPPASDLPRLLPWLGEPDPLRGSHCR